MHRNTYLASLFILKKDLYIKCCSCKDAWIKCLHLYAVTCQDVYLKLGFQQELVFMKPHTKTSMVLADTFWESMRMQYEMSTLFIFFKQAKITAPCWPYEYTSVCLMHINWLPFSASVNTESQFFSCRITCICQTAVLVWVSWATRTFSATAELRYFKNVKLPEWTNIKRGL